MADFRILFILMSVTVRKYVIQIFLSSNSSIFAQQAYLNLDKLILKNNNNYVIASASIFNTPDNISGVFNLKVNWVVDVLREQQRLNIFLPASDKDIEYSRVMFSSTVDTCKLSSGIISNAFSKTIYENYNRSSNIVFKCPFKAKTELNIVNCTVTDNFLPPLPFETKFKLEINFYGTLSEKRIWRPLYAITVYGRYKKWNVKSYQPLELQ